MRWWKTKYFTWSIMLEIRVGLLFSLLIIRLVFAVQHSPILRLYIQKLTFCEQLLVSKSSCSLRKCSSYRFGNRAKFNDKAQYKYSYLVEYGKLITYDFISYWFLWCHVFSNGFIVEELEDLIDGLASANAEEIIPKVSYLTLYESGILSYLCTSCWGNSLINDVIVRSHLLRVNWD